jgi:negative regulator of sigma E activity
MSEQQDKLSLLLDEYADDEQSRRMLDEVEADVNLQYRLRRYAMIGQVMRHELPKQIKSDFSANVMAQVNQIEYTAELVVDTESIPVNPRSSWTWSIVKPFAGLAIAASVAVVSITLWQTVNVDPGSAQDSEQVVSVDQNKIDRLTSLQVQTNAVPVGMRWKNSNAPALQQRLNAYLVNHTEYSNSIQGMSLIPQARVAGYDAQQ